MKRWTKARKYDLLRDIEKGDITEEEACKKHRLSKEELESWRKLFDTHGIEALRATRLQDYTRDTTMDKDN